ncbi:MAG: hypothetical protein QM726_10765 [Chitinophagaceae bacterium]
MYRLILTVVIVSVCCHAIAQPPQNTNDSMLMKAIQKQIIFPYDDNTNPTAGITLVKVSKQADSLYIDVIYASGNQFKLDHDKYFRYRMNKYKARFPEGYAVYVPIYFQFHLDGERIVIPDNATEERLAQTIKSLDDNTHLLSPIIVEGYPVVH